MQNIEMNILMVVKGKQEAEITSIAFQYNRFQKSVVCNYLISVPFETVGKQLKNLSVCKHYLQKNTCYFACINNLNEEKVQLHLLLACRIKACLGLQPLHFKGL